MINHLYNGLSKLDTKYSNDNDSDILKLRLRIGALSCREKEEILVQSLKQKLSLRQSEVKKKLMSWPQDTAYNLT